MKYLYKESNKYLPAKGANEATHLILTIEEYNALKDMIYKSEDRISVMKADADQLKEILARERRSNMNLLRIHKERSNADRGLKPKKGRSGYVVLQSREVRIRVDKDHTAWMWETIIQTPYTIDLSDGEARVYIDRDKRHILDQLGIKELAPDEDVSGQNALYKESCRANYRSGYWELLLTHTEALGAVPPDMRMTRGG